MLLDPDALHRALPGCQRLVAEDGGQFDVTLKVGVAAIKGTVVGKVELRDLAKPDRYTMAVNGKGSIGIASGTAMVQLQDDGDTTLVEVAGGADIHGLVASVGQRMLRGVAGRMMDQFFKSIEQQLLERKHAAREAHALIQEEPR